MSEIGTRIFELRKTLNLSMEKFGTDIGITKSSINSLEKGVNKPSEQTLKLICREFNVNYFWLRDGAGDMFIDIPDTVLDELEVTYDMTTYERNIVERYLKLTKEERREVEKILKKMFDIK